MQLQFQLETEFSAWTRAQPTPHAHALRHSLQRYLAAALTVQATPLIAAACACANQLS
jgi:hypothetical protein